MCHDPGLLLTQAAEQIVGHHITWHNLEYVETRNPAHFIEFALLRVLRIVLHLAYATRTYVYDKIM